MENNIELKNNGVAPQTSTKLIKNQDDLNEVTNPTTQNINPYVCDYVAPIHDKPVDKDVRKAFAADANPLHSKSCKCHARSLFATILLGGGIASVIIYFVKPGSLSDQSVIIFSVISYISYILVACICNTFLTYLGNISLGANFENQYQKFRAAIGQLVFNATCYHYQTVVHKNGNDFYTTQEKVVTHRDTQNITPVRTVDISGQVDRIRSGVDIVFIHFLVHYQFTDERSRQKFDTLYYRFQQRNRIDAIQDFTCNYETLGLQKKQSFYVGQYCHYKAWFIVFSIFGLIWPYSLWIEKKVDRFSVDIIKQLTL